MQLDPSYGAGGERNPDGHAPISNNQTNDEAEVTARAYYENTVFEVVSLELKSQTENEIIFSVCVSKGGVTQEPNRTIFLQLNNGTWEVVNEGY